MQHECLIENDSGRSIHGMRIVTLSVHVALSPPDKGVDRQMQPVQVLEVAIAAIHGVEGPAFGNQLIENDDDVQLAVADMDKTRHIAEQIELRMHLHRRGGDGTSRHPRKQRERQVDLGGVQRVRRIASVHSKRLVDIQFAGNADQTLSEVGVDSPVARGVRIGQRIARDLTADAQVEELLRLRAKARFGPADSPGTSVAQTPHTGTGPCT
jgi:hypothetical protein